MNNKTEQITKAKTQVPVTISLVTLMIAAVIAGGGLAYGFLIAGSDDTRPISSVTGTTCTDTDGKDAFLTRGTVTLYNDGHPGNSYTDVCETTDHVVDYYCPPTPDGSDGIISPIVKGVSINSDSETDDNPLLAPEFNSTEADCSIEYGNGWGCKNGACVQTCGNGEIEPEYGEECDDGFFSNDYQCRPESAYTCNACKCEPTIQSLFPNHNDISADRANIVFIGVGQPSISRVEQLGKILIDLDDDYNMTPEWVWTNDPRANWFMTYKPLAEMEVFKDNLNKYNFWYLPEQLPGICTLPDDYSSNDYVWAKQRSAVAGNFYPVFLCNNDINNMNNDMPEVAGYAWPGESSYVEILDLNEIDENGDDPDMMSWRQTFLHEFGHQMFLLHDEYWIVGGDDKPGFPNCANSTQEANTWWGDLVGQSKEGLTVSTDEFNHCSYTAGNYRPTYVSVMQNINWEFRLGLVNERVITQVFDSYSGLKSNDVSYLNILLEKQNGQYSISEVKELKGIIKEDVGGGTIDHSLSFTAGDFINQIDFSSTGLFYYDEFINNLDLKNSVTLEELPDRNGGSEYRDRSQIELQIPLGENTFDSTTMNLLTSDGEAKDITLTITNKETKKSQTFTTQELLK